MRTFEPPSAIYKRLGEIDERQQAANRQVATMTPEQAARLASFHHWYPWVPAGVAYSLARSDAAVWNQPAVQQIAIAALAQQQGSAMGIGGQVGDPVMPDENLSPEQQKAMLRKKMGADWIAGHEGTNPLSRAVAPIGNKIAGIPGYSGKDLLNDVFGTDSTTGRAIRDNPLTNNVAEPFMRATVTGENPLPRGLRAVARNAGMLGDTPRQMLVGGYRAAPDLLEFPRHPLKALAQFQADIGTQTEIGQTIQGAVKPSTTGGGIDQGSGFMIGGGAKARQNVAEQQWGTILYPDGTVHARTPGRDFAGLFFEPGSNAYAATSGALDLTIAVGADKLSFGEVANARKLDKAFQVEGMGPRAIKAAEEGEKATRTANLLDSAGAIWNPGQRATVSPEFIDSFLASKTGGGLTDYVSKTSSLRSLDRRTGGKLDPSDIKALADETDPDATRAMLAQMMKTGNVTPMQKGVLSNYGFKLKEAVPENIARLEQRMPRLGRNARKLRDIRDSFTQMTREMDYLDIPEEHQEPFLRKLATKPDFGIDDPHLASIAEASYRRTVFEDFEEYVTGHIATQIGMDEKSAGKFRTMMKREQERLASETNYNTEHGKPKSFFNLKVRTTSRNVGNRNVGEDLGDIVDAEVVDPTALGSGPRSGRGEPPPKPGHVRLYRGENPSRGFGKMGGGVAGPEASADLAGTWWTNDPQMARDYANDFGRNPGGKVHYTDVPIGKHEFVDIDGNPIDQAAVSAYQHGDRTNPEGLKVFEANVNERGQPIPEGGGELERTGRPLSPDDAQEAELLNEFDNWETTTILDQPDIPTPSQINELQSEFMPTPDWRAVKHQMGDLRKLYEHGLDIPISTIRDLQSVWKGLVITRPALFFRVVGEIQVAMTLRGAATWFTHPLDQIAWVLGDSKVPDALEAMGKGATDIRGQRFGNYEDDAGEWVKAQERWMEFQNQSTFYHPKDTFIHEHFPIAKKSVNPDDFYLGMADELHTVAKDPFGSMVTNALLNGMNDDEIVDFAWKNMEDARKVLAVHFAKSDGAKILTLEGTDDYIRNHMIPRVLQASGGGNQELLSALKTGRLGDVPFDIKGVRNDALNEKLKEFADILPDEMRVPRTLHSTGKKSVIPALKAAHSWALDVMFSNRERTLSRSPQMRKFYFKNAMANASLMDPADAEQFAANLEKAGMKASDVRQAKYHARKPVSGPNDQRLAEFEQRMADIPTHTPPPGRTRFDPSSFNSADEHLPEGSGIVKRSTADIPDLGDEKGTIYGYRDSDGKLTGYLYIEDRPSGSIVSDVSVHPDARRQGIAKKLYKAAHADGIEIDKLGAESMTEGGRAARRSAVRDVLPTSGLSLKQVDDLSFNQARDDMAFFLEDLVDKRRFIEGVSIISPFADVLSESMERWAHIFANPSSVTKVQRLVKTPFDPETGDLVGLNRNFAPIRTEDIETKYETVTNPDGSTMQVPVPDDLVYNEEKNEWYLEHNAEGVRQVFDTDPREEQAARRGLFYKDANGEERVAFPLSGKMMGILGAPVPLQGRLQGMNMIGDFTPGVGPFASFPLAVAKDRIDSPAWDPFWNWVFPAGPPKDPLSWETAAPGWLKKVVKDNSSQEIIDAMYYKSGTGQYNTSGEGATKEEITRLFNDSKETAKMARIGNAIATTVSPTSPSTEWFIDTPTGQRIPLLSVAKDIQQMRKDDPANATINAMQKYGDNVYLMLVGKSVAVSPGILPATKEAEDWIRTDGKGLRGKYKDTYGFFAPQEGDFSFDAYKRMLDNGDRKLTNPEDVPLIANDMVAKARYYALRAKLDDPTKPAQAALLRNFRAQLEKEYPGYTPGGAPGGTINKAEPRSMIAELEGAVADKKLQDHAAMPALQRYLTIRDQVRAAAPKGRGEDWWLTSKDGKGVRAILAQLGDQLQRENPAFGGMWEGALRREFEGQLELDDATNAAGG